MFRDLQSLLDYEVRKRPALAAILDDLDKLSFEQIDALPYLKWIRQALKERTFLLYRKQIFTAAEAALEGHVVEGFTPDPPGTMRRWTGGECFVALDRGEWLLPTGTLFWLPDSGGVWLKTAFSNRIDPRLLSQSLDCGPATKTEYTQRFREEEARNAPADAPVMAPLPGDVNPLAALGVRISR